MAAVALSASPGLAAVNPTEKRNANGPVAFPLLALQAGGNTASPNGHYSHSSHVSHSSHYSGSHNSHASHYSHSSHFSSSPSSSPSPTPTAVAPRPVPTHRKTAVKISHKRGTVKVVSPSTSATPSPTRSTASPSASFSPSPASYHGSSGDWAGEVVIAVVVIGGVTLYIYRRKRRSG